MARDTALKPTLPHRIKLVITNEYWNGTQFVQDGLTVVNLNEYKNRCSNSFPKIWRVSTSTAQLRKWIRSFNYHVKQNGVEL